MNDGSMNAERLLEHYEKIADAPDAIARLRRFILDLAVRGKLVPQEAGDEPASELLKRIAGEKARLVKAGEVRKPRAIPTLSEPPFPLPSNWRWSQLAEVGVLSPRNEAPDTLEASFVPMPLIAAEYGVANQHEVRPWGEIKKGYTHFAEGDVGLAKITPCFENGKSTVFRDLTGGIGAGTTELHVVRPLFVDQDYILLFLKSPHFIDTGIPKMTGTAGQKRVPTEYFAHSPFPLPPFAEQHRIVAKVDELMGLCDRLEAARVCRETVRNRLAAASLVRLNAPDPETFEADARFALDALPALTTRPDQIKALRQTILNLAVRGKLVRQDANDEPASELLKRIAKEKARLVKTGQAKRHSWLPEIDLDQAPFALPAGWAWGRFPEVGTFGRGKSKHRPRNDPALFDGGHHLMIQTGDVARSRGVIETHTNKYNDFGLSQSFKWPKGTLCITIAANIADSGILSFDACFPDSVVGFIPAPMFENARYFEYFVRTAKANLLEFAPATAQKNINLEILTQVIIPLPPLAEQRRIVTKVDALMALCDRLEASLTATAATRRRLLQALLAEALAPGEDQKLKAAE
jgi:type I restriction enzyme S subunit